MLEVLESMALKGLYIILQYYSYYSLGVNCDSCPPGPGLQTWCHYWELGPRVMRHYVTLTMVITSPETEAPPRTLISSDYPAIETGPGRALDCTWQT